MVKKNMRGYLKIFAITGLAIFLSHINSVKEADQEKQNPAAMLK